MKVMMMQTDCKNVQFAIKVTRFDTKKGKTKLAINTLKGFMSMVENHRYLLSSLLSIISCV